MARSLTAEQIIGHTPRRKASNLPPDPDGQNDDRASWAEEAIVAFESETGCDREDALADLLADLRQFVRRPTLGLHPWKTPIEGVYLCSSSTPPGGGVHGMCGWHAAQEVMRQSR